MPVLALRELEDALLGEEAGDARDDADPVLAGQRQDEGYVRRASHAF